MTVVERRVALDASGCPPLCAACGMALRERCVTLLCDFRWFVRVGVRFGPVLGCAVSSLCGVSPTTFGGSGGDRPFGASEVDVQELKPRPRRPRVVNSHAEPEEVLRWQSRGRCGCSCLTVSSVVKGLQTNDQLTISRLRLLTSQRHRHSAHTRRHSGHELGNERTRRGGARIQHARSDHARTLVARGGRARRSASLLAGGGRPSMKTCRGAAALAATAMRRSSWSCGVSSAAGITAASTPPRPKSAASAPAACRPVTTAFSS